MGLSPISASLGAMGSLPRKLDELLATGHWALRGLVMDEIEQLTTDLHILYNFLVKLSTAQDPPMTARYWMKDVRDLSYDMLDCADQFVHANDRAKIRRATRRKIITRLKINCLPERWKWRPWITNKVSEFRIRAREATQRYWRYNLDGCSSNPGYSCFRRELPSILPDPGDLVGIEGPMNELQRWLANGEEQLKVVSIVGVGGIGKTTLAQKLWGKLHRQFECRAFVRTAQKPDMRGLIRSILSQVRRHQPHQPPDSGEMHHLIRDLREYLRNKRYFVIIDDLWATSVWDVLSRAFPEDNCCSRIITITEIMEVALACCGFCPEHIFKMECLSDDDSEKLLLRNILVPGNQQFDNVLPQIKRNCGGLPLAIIIAASLLASQPEKLEQLGCMQNSFGVNHTMEGFMGQILNISFNSLPHYLKTCLLHLSTHPEGHLFFKGDLVKQWVAEGFICAKEGEDMEEVAGSYFDELVSTGLIQAMDINYNYEVLSYSVHHMVLDFITYKSIEDNFITVVDYSQTTMPVIDKVRRLSLHFGSATYATTPASIRLSQVRSLFFSGLFNCVPSFMVFKLLRVLVLHFSGDTGNTSFNLQGICELFSLRYLQVACNVPVKLPDQIEPMKNLKTLEMNVGVCAVPPDIVRLSNLLHLRLRSETKLPDGVGCMRSLRTLMYFDLVSSSEDNILGLGELTNLRDLHLTCSSSLSSEHLKKKLIALSTSVGKLGNLKSFMLASGAAGTAVTFDALSSMYSTPVFLERLELLPRICVFSRFPKWIGQLHKLRVQKIAVRELLMNDIDSLTGLHSLTVLSLCVKTAPERRIVFNDGAFPFLKYFKFRCGILYMSFMSGAMDNLRRLKLRFNAHIGEKYDNMLAGVEHLLNLQDIAGQIGAATESEKRASESALKDAISKHPRCPNFNVKWVDPVDEEYHPSKKHHQMQGGLSGEKHGVLEKAEDTNKYADGWLSQNSDLPSSVASCRLKSGLMENFSPRTLLNSISHIGVLTSDGSTARPKPIQKYCQNVCDISSIVRPLIEDICISPEEQLNEVLMELDSAINEASGLIGNWHQTTSKIYFVWQIESVISDIQGCSLQLCQLANSLLPSLTDCACICIQKLQDIKYEHIFDLVKEVARELNGKDTQSPENLSIVSSSLSLSTNLELYMEAVSLENLRTRAMRSENRKELELVEEMISMVNYMHERLLRETQLLNINGVPIPADFCCPLSLELMSDPVILASGQTYERVYIKLWLDEGFTICPKTRQRLAHSNLTPNYTVKALISNWRESTGNSPLHRSAGRGIFPGSSEADLYMRSLNRASPPHSAVHQNSDAHVNRPGHERESSLEGRHAGFNSGQLDGECDTNSGMICVPSDRANYSCDASGEVADGGPSVAQKENTILPILGDVSLRGQFVWQQTSDKGSPRIKSSSSMDARGDLSAIENQVCKLIDDLRSNSKEAQRSATSEIHLLAKHNMENRIVIANCGAINLLVGLLHSPDAKKQENAVTALLNLSINDNNKIAIANAGAVDPLIHVLETGNPEAKENSAATLFSLSVIEENKMRIGRSGAIKLLVDLLANGTLQGKKDAATALFNLSVLDENKGRIVQAGAVKHLVELMDPAARMIDKAVAVVANLATIPEGRTAIGQARGIPALVDVVQLGSARGKENAAAALLQLCTNSNRFCSIVLQEGAVPPLVALSQSGTPRAREKAQALLSYFRSQRHGNSARR